MTRPALHVLQVSWGRRFKHYLVAGMFVTIPVGLAVLVVAWFMEAIDRSASPVLDAFLNKHVPGLGLLASFLVVLATGFLASHVVGQTLLEIGERALLRIPVFSWVYKAIKQVVDAFSPGSQGSFSGVVIVEYPAKGIRSIGFVTRELEGRLGSEPPQDMVAVYIPTNHFYFGNYALFKKADVLHTGLSVQDGIQISLSAGAGIPAELSARAR